MTLADLAKLRHYIDEQDETTYANQFLLDLITSEGSVEAAAAVIWSMKASRYATLVDTAEAGASRKMSQMADNARKQATYYGGGGATGGATTGRYTVTRPIERV